MTADHAAHGEHPAWGLLDMAVYLAAGIVTGILIAVLIGRGQFPIVIPDSPAELIDKR